MKRLEFVLFILTQTILGSKQLVNNEQLEVKPNRILSGNQIKCNTKGNCVREDNIPLIIGYAPRIPLNMSPKSLNEEIKEIVSIDPIGGAISPIFLKGSTKYICGDGVNECFNSCCRDGFCSDPSNYCTIALKSSSAIIYSTCIAFFILTCVYWIIFGCIGINYSKRRARILKNETINLAESEPKSALEDFNDAFNTRPTSAKDNTLENKMPKSNNIIAQMKENENKFRQPNDLEIQEL